MGAKGILRGVIVVRLSLPRVELSSLGTITLEVVRLLMGGIEVAFLGEV